MSCCSSPCSQSGLQSYEIGPRPGQLPKSIPALLSGFQRTRFCHISCPLARSLFGYLISVFVTRGATNTDKILDCLAANTNKIMDCRAARVPALSPAYSPTRWGHALDSSPFKFQRVITVFVMSCTLTRSLF